MVAKRRYKHAALKFLRKLMKRHGVADEVVTDRFASYRAGLRDLGATEKQKTGRWLNNRVENSHLPFRQRECAMQRFRLMRSLQEFAFFHSSVYYHFNQERSLTSRHTFNIHATICIFQIKSQRRAYCSKSRICRQEGRNFFDFG
ncbi:DDE-type integrase/transposase/recombinase [Ruegeria sp. AU67]|uniref:DDE-type integrase/transposase/recombinase n=1 Tax=Ruegeria sp. AU67 TaxID=2108530 RepID=UPI003517F782